MYYSSTTLRLGRLLEREEVSSIVIDASDEDVYRTEEYVDFIDVVKEALSKFSPTSGIQVRA